MKKFQFYVMTLLMVILSSVCFFSCDSKTDPADDIIGTWVFLDDEGYSTKGTYFSETISFKKDKTYKLYWVEDTGIYDRGVFTGEESGTWSYNPEAHTLTITTIIGEKPGTHTCSVIIQDNKMYFLWGDEMEGPYIKQ